MANGENRGGDWSGSLTFHLPSVRRILPTNFFWAKGVRFLSCRISGFPKIIRLFLKISGNFRERSEKFRSSEVSRCFWDRLKRNNPLGFLPSIGEPGIRSVIYVDHSFVKLDPVYVFLWYMGHLKLTRVHLWVRRAKLVCRSDLVWDSHLRHKS